MCGDAKSGAQPEVRPVYASLVDASVAYLSVELTVDPQRLGQEAQLPRGGAVLAPLGSRLRVRDPHALGLVVGDDKNRARQLLLIRGAAGNIPNDGVPECLSLGDERVDPGQYQQQQRGQECAGAQLERETTAHEGFPALLRVAGSLSRGCADAVKQTWRNVRTAGEAAAAQRRRGSGR